VTRIELNPGDAHAGVHVDANTGVHVGHSGWQVDVYRDAALAGVPVLTRPAAADRCHARLSATRKHHLGHAGPNHG